MQLYARGFVLRRNWIVPAIFVGLGVVGALLGAFGQVPLFGWFMAWVGLLMGPAVAARNGFPRELPMHLSASARGITLDVERVAPESLAAEEIVETKMATRGLDALVTLVHAKRTLVLRLTKHDGRALMGLLGARRASFRTAVPLWKRFFGALPLFLLFAALSAETAEMWILSLPSMMTMALVVAALLGFVRGKLVVGADGFTTKWLVFERFTPFRDITSIASKTGWNGTEVDPVVTTKNGKKRRFRAVEVPNTEAERNVEGRALLGHLMEAWGRAQAGGGVRVDVPALVGRAGRSDAEWLAAIDGLARGGGSGYRVAALSPEMLAETTSDPGAPADARLGAAATLVRMGDARDRAKVRVAAEACAETDLRAALLAMADAEDDAAAAGALRTLRR